MSKPRNRSLSHTTVAISKTTMARIRQIGERCYPPAGPQALIDYWAKEAAEEMGIGETETQPGLIERSDP